MKEMFKQLCTPAKIYFVITILSSIIMLFSKGSISVIAVNLLFALLWTCILSWLCKKGFTTLSWVLVLLPYISLLWGMMQI